MFRYLLDDVHRHPSQGPFRRETSSRVPRRRPAKRRLCPAFEWLESREILSLMPVSPQAPFPFTAIVKIDGTFPDGQSYCGSGVMVDSFHVLTAGHMIYDYDDGGWATSMRVIPEFSAAGEPFGAASMTEERTFTTWEAFSEQYPDQTGPGALDIGMITLDRPIGDETGWMAYGASDSLAAYATGSVYDTAGYPADPACGFAGSQMFYESGPISGLSSDGSVIEYGQASISTYPGQSGSPLWADSTGVVSGIVVGWGTVNYATRITPAIDDVMQTWIASDVPPAAAMSSPEPPAVTSIGPTWHTRLGVTSIGVAFDEPLDPASACDPGRYSVEAIGTRRVCGHDLTVHRGLQIKCATYDSSACTTRIYLARPHDGPLKVVVSPGMAGADGAVSQQAYWRVIRPSPEPGHAADPIPTRRPGNGLSWATHLVGAGGRIRVGAGVTSDDFGEGDPSSPPRSPRHGHDIPIDLGSTDALRFE